MSSIKNIPAVDEVLRQEKIAGLFTIYNRSFVTDLIREATDGVRQMLRHTEPETTAGLTRAELTERIVNTTVDLVAARSRGTLIPVINGTGVVLHTNLGRAPLGQKALDYIQEIASAYNNLEINLETGERGSRYHHVEELLCRITGAEAALVVNNNAAAVLLGLNTFAQRKQVLVSRGQLIEIGGSFRIPEIMKMSGAYLYEVGTTNKTYKSDFARAIGEETGLLFSAHTSNYKILGFAQDIKIEDLVELGRQYQLPVMQDLGSGVLYDLSSSGLKEEPVVQDCVTAGVDIITFSGDKLLGGPQAGLIVGKKAYIDKMKQNQLLRALRVGKITIAALEGTLLEYLAGTPQEYIPVLAMLAKTEKQLTGQGQRLLRKLKTTLGNHTLVEKIRLVPFEDMVGGGAYPTYTLAGVGVEIKLAPDQLEPVAQALRQQNPAILIRKQEDSMRISVRTLLEHDQEKIVEGIQKALQTIQMQKIDQPR